MTFLSLQDDIMVATSNQSIVYVIRGFNLVKFLIKNNKICDFDAFSKFLTPTFITQVVCFLNSVYS